MLLWLVFIGGCGRVGFDSMRSNSGDDGGTISGSSIQRAYLKASNTDPSDYFGLGVALSADGTTLAVGAEGESSAATGIDGNQADNSAVLAGAVYIFASVGTTWGQQAYLKASNTDAYDLFGANVVLSADGNTLAVGAHGEANTATGINGDQTNNAANVAGAVYVFVRSGTTWTQQAYLKASNTGAVDYFGGQVALSADGNMLAVSASGEDSAATGIGGNQADNNATDSGAVYMFVRSGTTWVQQAYIKASNTNTGDNFGTAIALSADGGTLAVGAVGEDSTAIGIGGNQADNKELQAGAVYVFVRAGTAWTQQAYVKASNTAFSHSFGFSVALSSTGDALAVSALGEASSATGVNGNEANNSAFESGAVYVFVRAGVSWSQEAYVKASNTGRGDYFGRGIALSGDGNVLAVGASNESSAATGLGGDQTDDSKLNSGATYVFGRSGASWSQLAYVKASNTDAEDGFGSLLEISADASTLVVSAYNEASAAIGIDGDQTSNAAPSSGAVYVIR